MRDLRNELNVATQCGRCACHARDVLKEALYQIQEPMIASAA
ncbi:bacterioferritin-associated ferredoxin [Chitinivorax tropicus]|uniref:Bacterioferritin-associated ferredoxin n=2 Tax=Chitinivorax tropicus TaxID=714531 RepID=A0A840MP71_9PROT|nr:bacterioferritin-associated ferredoxin [Chitinivorax tropicus]